MERMSYRSLRPQSDWRLETCAPRCASCRPLSESCWFAPDRRAHGKLIRRNEKRHAESWEFPTKSSSCLNRFRPYCRTTVEPPGVFALGGECGLYGLPPKAASLIGGL